MMRHEIVIRIGLDFYSKNRPPRGQPQASWEAAVVVNSAAYTKTYQYHRPSTIPQSVTNSMQYLLIRPYPSLRILFASPTLRVPGILQSPFLNKIGGSSRVRDELTTALAEGRGVTAKVRWVSRVDEDGRNRWIHCTPLLGSNGQIGVWMIVLVDDDSGLTRRWKQAPPVGPHRGKVYGSLRDGRNRSELLDSSPNGRGSSSGSIHTGNVPKAQYHLGDSGQSESLRSASPNSVRI